MVFKLKNTYIYYHNYVYNKDKFKINFSFFAVKKIDDENDHDHDDYHHDHHAEKDKGLKRVMVVRKISTMNTTFVVRHVISFSMHFRL